MKNILALQQKIIPEMIELLDKRYHILKSIYYNQPIGRRSLSQELSLGERIVRTEVNFLKSQGLIEINSIGMIVTSEGESILESLAEAIHEINGLSVIEENIQRILKIHKVIVIPGDSDNDHTVLREMGRATANYVKDLLNESKVLALTGGTSVAEFVNNFPKVSNCSLTVVPARGGIGGKVETQAGTLAAKLANKIGAEHKLLHVPDNLSLKALEMMMNEPEIRNVINIISKADILVFGIGRADEMSRRRGLNEDEIKKLLEEGAVAEAFGYYFNNKGEIIYKTPTMAIDFNDVKNIKNIIAVAGGKNKAEAIIATKTENPQMVLVTDEGCAKEILKIKEKKEK